MAGGQSISWSPVHGPYSGVVQTLTVDRSGDVLGTTFDGREEVYISTDAGEHWRLSLSLLVFGYEPCLAVDSSNDIYYGDAESGLLKSTDRGATWQKTNLGRGASAVSLISGNRICAGGSKTVSISGDGGKTWSTSQVRGDQGDVSTIVEDSLGDIYAGFYLYFGYYSTGGGIYMSSDSGRTWSLSGLSSDSVISMTRGSDGKVFASASSGSHWSIYSTGEGKSNWTPDAAGIPSGVPIATLETDRLGETIAVTDSGLYMYDNAKSRWEAAAPAIGHGASITTGCYDPNGVSYIGTRGDGVFLLDNRQSGWRQCGIVPAPITAIGTDSTGRLFAGTSGAVFEKSLNDSSWIMESDGLDSGSVYQFYWSPSEQKLYAATSTGLFYITRGADYWVPMIRQRMYDCIVIPGKYLLAGSSGGVQEFDYANGLWSMPPSIGLPLTRIYCIALDSANNVLAGTDYAGVFKSTDGGTFWSEVGFSSPLIFQSIRSLAVDSRDGVFAGTDTAGAFYSGDGGDTWTRINSIAAKEVSAFLVTGDSEYYAAAGDQGVFVSGDRGLDWWQGNDGLGGASVTCLAFDRQGTVYAGTDSGLYASAGVVTSVHPNEKPPSSFALQQNYPNPFNPITAITYRVSNAGRITLKIYDILGRVVATLVDGLKQPGTYTIRFDGAGLASGVYFCRLTAGDYSKTIKMALLK